jgi:hypothetical protein
MAQHNITIECTGDTYTDYLNQNSNYGLASPILIGGNGPVLGDNLGRRPRYAAWFYFDLSAIGRKRIVSCELVLYAITYPLNKIEYNYARASFPGAGDFTENNITVNHKPISEWGESVNVSAVSNMEIGHNAIIGVTRIYDTGTRQMWIGAEHPVEWGAGISLGTGQIAARESANPARLEIVYEDVPPEPPTLLSPIGLFAENTNVIRFEWQYSSSVGGEQKKFDLQWSANGVTWTTVSQTTANNYYDMPANTIPSGNIYWRVRTYNEYDEAGEYSDTAVFYSVGAPRTPTIISVSNSARPEITWASTEQQVYQIQISHDENIVYDSGSLPGISIKNHKVKTFLDDGLYTARVRIKNEYDMWSDWTEYPFTISTSKPPKPTIAVQRSRYGLEIHSSGAGYVYRDGVCIGKIDKQYFDNTVVHGQEYQYFVRVVNGGAYNDSDVVLAIPYIPFAVLSLGNDIVELRYGLNVVPGKNLTRTSMGTANYFDGRKFPVYEQSEHMQSGIALTYFIKKYEDIQNIIKFMDLKEIVLYRDKRGKKIYGVITNISVQDIIQGYNITFTLSETDYNEEVQPDA